MKYRELGENYPGGGGLRGGELGKGGGWTDVNNIFAGSSVETSWHQSIEKCLFLR